MDALGHFALTRRCLCILLKDKNRILQQNEAKVLSEERIYIMAINMIQIRNPDMIF